MQPMHASGRTQNPRASLRASALPTSTRRSSRGPTDSPAAAGAALRRSSIGRPNTGALAAPHATQTPTVRSQPSYQQQLQQQQQQQQPRSEAPSAGYEPADRSTEKSGLRTPVRATKQIGILRQAPTVNRNTTPVRNPRTTTSASYGAAQTTGSARTPTTANTSSNITPRRAAVTPGRNISAGGTTPVRGPPAGTTSEQGAATTLNTVSTPDRGTAALARATPGYAAGTSAPRPGLVASPYQRRTSYGNGTACANTNNVVRRLNLNPAPASTENNNPVASQSTGNTNQVADSKVRRNGSAIGAQGSPYVRRNGPRGSRIAIDRVERTPLGTFSSRTNVLQEPANSTLTNIGSPRTSTLLSSQQPTQQQTVRRLTALESFRNSRRASDPKNVVSAQDPLSDLHMPTPDDSEQVLETVGDTLLSRMGALRVNVHHSEDITPMPDRQEEPFGFRSGPARGMHDNTRSNSLPSSPAGAKTRTFSDRFTEGTINTERVELMSLSLNRRRSRGRSGGPSDFPEETPTLTVPVYHHS